MRSQAVPVQVPRVKLQTGYLDRNIQNTRHRHARPRLEVEKRFNVEEWRSWRRQKQSQEGRNQATW
jgi:hypothetical protein